MKKGVAGVVIVCAAAIAAYFGLRGDPVEETQPTTEVVVDQTGTVVSPVPTTEAPAAAPAQPEVEPEPETQTARVDPAPATPAPSSTVAPAPDPTERPATPAPDATGSGAPEQPSDGSALGESDPEPATTGAAPTETETAPPSFDVVRVDRDGQTVIAGSAEPGEKVEILLDGAVVGDAIADNAGKFVAIITAEMGEEARQLQLRTRLPVPEATATADAEASSSREASQPAGTADQPSQADSSEPSDTGTTPPLAVRETDKPSSSGAEAPAEIAQGGDQVAARSPAEPAAPQPGRLNPDAERVADPAPSEGGTTATAAETSSQPATPSVPTNPEAATAPDPTYALSAPVIILPAPTDDAAPALVQPQEEQVALLQPQGSATSVTLDAIRYGETGAVRLNGRGAPGNSVRIYGNGESLGDTGIQENGTWAWALARERALGIRLFRFDELSPSGAVASRIETPFTYEALSPKVVRKREVVIERGDVLWRIAEQYYGEGIRFSLIYGANADLIRDPDLIYPGQVFTVPELVDAN